VKDWLMKKPTRKHRNDPPRSEENLADPNYEKSQNSVATDNYVNVLQYYRGKNTIDYFDITHVLHASQAHFYINNYQHLYPHYGYPPTMGPYMYPPPPVQLPRTPLFVANTLPKKRVIDCSIQTIADLVAILDKYPYDPQTEYNIDLKNLHKIREELSQLNQMVGLSSLKTSILNQLIYFIQEPILCDKNRGYKHTILCGPPGTGKTEIAKIIGRMYAKLGVLGGGDQRTRTEDTAGSHYGPRTSREGDAAASAPKSFIFRKVTRNDLVAGYLGQTAIKTRDVVDSCLGGCLFIDEAYSLGNSCSNDGFSRECVDTLCEALSDHKDNLMVIIAGYETQLKEQFFTMNPGLESRFIWKFTIDHYTSAEICEILGKKVRDDGWTLDIDDKTILGWFEKHKSDFKHYGRDVEQLLLHSKIVHARRIYGKPRELSKKITMEDLENGRKVLIENQPRPAASESLYGLYV